MPAAPKLSDYQWRKARKHWEGDPRNGYVWLVRELSLPVTDMGVKKRACRDGWKKDQERISNKAVEAKVLSTGKKAGSQTIATNKKAQPLPLNPESIESFGWLREQFGLTDQQELFAREYASLKNARASALRAGYSRDYAERASTDLLGHIGIRAAIDHLLQEQASRAMLRVEDIEQLWAAVSTADVNEIVQHRRNSCRHCWGEGFVYLHTPSTWAKVVERHNARREKALEADKPDPGELLGVPDGGWYDKNKAPNPDCPECGGDGVGEIFIADTRYLSQGARLLYAGVKESREGIEVIHLSKERALENLARMHGMFREAEVTINLNGADAIELQVEYERIMMAARIRQAQVLESRREWIEGKAVRVPQLADNQ